MWKPFLCSALCAFSLVLAAADTASSDDTGKTGTRTKTMAMQRLGDDLFIAGGTVTVNEPVAADLIVSGGNIDVDAAVAGDAVALGGKVRLGVGVGHSVYAAAGQLTINGRVGRNVRVAGGQIELGPQSEVVGNVSAVGGQVRLHGKVNGHVQTAGSRVLIDGPVAGDVIATSGQVELGPNARIAGKLRYRSNQALRQDELAQVLGGIEQMTSPAKRGDEGRMADRERSRHGIAALLGGVWTLGLIVLAAILLAALPDLFAAIGQTMRERLGMSLLLGFAFLVCVPVAAVIVLATLIGIPLGLLALALYALLVPLAYVSASIGLADWALWRWLPGRSARLVPRIAASAAMLLILSLLGWIPVLGGLIGFLVLLAGLGALMLQTPRIRR